MGDLYVPFDCTITSVSLLADQTGDIIVDILKDSYANYPPTIADSITGGVPPEIVAGVKYYNDTLSGWTTSLNAGDTIRFYIDGDATDIGAVTVAINVAIDLEKGGQFFTAFRAMEVMSVSEVHAVAASDAGTVELDIEKLEQGEAPGTGVSVLASPFDLTGTANTVTTYTGRFLSSDRVLAPTDRLSAVFSGVLTDVSDVQITVYLKYWGRGDYY
jgi:hypothetical protein